MSQPFNLLVCDLLSAQTIEKLRAIPGMVVHEKYKQSLDELYENISEVEGVVVRSATKITADVLAHAKKLKLIARSGTGYDNIDVVAAKLKNIAVMNTPAQNSVAAAELSIALMFALMRHIPFAHTSMQQGLWERQKFMGREITGKTLGLVGLGNVGRHVAKRAQALGMHVVAYDPFVTTEVMRGLNIVSKDLKSLIEMSDVISLHLTLSTQTQNLFDAQKFGWMKNEAVLINCSRGGVVDELALIEALNLGKLSGAALDVFSVEPLGQNHPLMNHPKIILTPHLGASTVESQEQTGLATVDQIRVFVTTGKVLNEVTI